MEQAHLRGFWTARLPLYRLAIKNVSGKCSQSGYASEGSAEILTDEKVRAGEFTLEQNTRRARCSGSFSADWAIRGAKYSTI